MGRKGLGEKELAEASNGAEAAIFSGGKKRTAEPVIWRSGELSRGSGGNLLQL